MQDNEQQDPGQDIAGEGRMITALTWVPRGHAKAVLQMADPEADEQNILAHSRMQKKLAG